MFLIVINDSKHLKEILRGPLRSLNVNRLSAKCHKVSPIIAIQLQLLLVLYKEAFGSDEKCVGRVHRLQYIVFSCSGSALYKS